MGIFDRFPYSSTHEMNLDFMLGKATEIAESLQEIDTHKEQAEQAATNAAQSAQSAAQAAQAAAGSQTAAGTSASQAAQHKADAEDAADRAEAASDLADDAVEQAQAAATTAGTAAQNASTAADGAIASATAAETRINTLAASLPEDFTELNTEVNNLKSAFNDAINTNENLLKTVLHDGYWKRSLPIDWSTSSVHNAYEGIRIHTGTTYYYRNVFLFYSVILYDNASAITTLTTDTAQSLDGSFTAESDGTIYITSRKDIAPLFTDSEILYNSGKTTTFYTPNNFIVESETNNKITDTKDGYYIDSNGSESSAQGYTITGYIPINSNFLTLTAKGQTFYCFYNDLKSAIDSRIIINFEDKRTTQIPVPDTAKFIRLSFAASNINNFYLSVLPTDGTFIYDVGTQKPYTSFTKCINDATGRMNSIVYVHTGTYNLLTEQGGNTYFDSYTYTTDNVGIRLKNNIHIIGSGAAIITFLYTGKNTDVMKYYSPLNALAYDNYGFTIENLTIKASNCRYCVHDDRGNDTDDYTNKYINCIFDIDNSENSNGYPQCIGGGLGVSGNIEIKNCFFKSRYVTQSANNSVASYHNSSNANAQSRIIIFGCYCDGGTLRVSYYGTSTKKTEALIHGNSVESAIIKSAEGQATVDNIDMYEWNNIIRT